MTVDTSSSPAKLLSQLGEHDRDRLGQAMRRLMVHGSILGLEASQSDLYHWCRQNRDWLDELAGLFELKLHWDHEDRAVQAVPQNSLFLLHLRLDATLVLLTLWYEFDIGVRDRGETPPVRLTVQQLNDALTAKFEPLRKHMPSMSRLREILALAQRKNLVRVVVETAFESSIIEVLPTLKRVIPFQSLDEWTRHADRYVMAKEAAGEPEGSGADAEDSGGEQA